MDILGMMKKAQQMQAKMADVQTALENTLVEGASGSGAVQVQMTAKGDLVNVVISEELLAPGEKDVLEGLILAAHADARKKASDIAAAMMQEATAGIPLPPGLKLPF